MAAPVNSSSDCWGTPEVYKHHEQSRVCISRPKYREGRKARAVKVYTINSESRYLMVQGVPAIGVMMELVQLCALYGVVEEYRPLDEYPAEEFTEVYLIKFQRLTSARAAKRRMDEKSFYGGVLHVCYVPEYETVEDTRLKLQDRRRYVIRTVHNIAREKQRKEAVDEEPTSPDTAAKPEATFTRRHKTSDSRQKGGTSNFSHYSPFPLLPFPPSERLQPQNRTMPTEDRMGTLHNAIVDTKQQRAEPSSSSCQTPSDGGRHAEQRPSASQAAAVRFVPRTTHLENKKRKKEDASGLFLEEVSGNNEQLIGPRLPEELKVDMEDKSLNTTLNLIRNTMKQVESAPDLKPVAKKVKARRRI